MASLGYLADPLTQQNQHFLECQGELDGVGEFLFSCDMERGRFTKEGIDLDTVRRVIQCRSHLDNLAKRVAFYLEQTDQQIENAMVCQGDEGVISRMEMNRFRFQAFGKWISQQSSFLQSLRNGKI